MKVKFKDMEYNILFENSGDELKLTELNISEPIPYEMVKRFCRDKNIKFNIL